MRTIALYTTETMADWEYAYLTAQIARAETVSPGRFVLKLVGDGLAGVLSLGAMPIYPTVDLAELVDDESLAALVIPGGDHYDSGHDRLIETIHRLRERHVPIAAICGATFLLARAGLLDDRTHTSNDLSFLQTSGYGGASRYTQLPAVTDDGVTTASGLHAVAFTAEVMRVTQLCPERIVAVWERLFSGGRSDDFFELTEAIREWQGAARD